jgi:hypothetical protein
MRCADSSTSGDLLSADRQLFQRRTRTCGSPTCCSGNLRTRQTSGRPRLRSWSTLSAPYRVHRRSPGPGKSISKLSSASAPAPRAWPQTSLLPTRKERSGAHCKNITVRRLAPRPPESTERMSDTKNKAESAAATDAATCFNDISASAATAAASPLSSSPRYRHVRCRMIIIWSRTGAEPAVHYKIYLRRSLSIL